MSDSLLKRSVRRRAFCFIPYALTLGAAVFLTSHSHAASASWTGGIGSTQSWATGVNWSTNTAPGATTGLTNADIATFNTAMGTTAITIDAGRNIRGITFDVGASGTITIGGDGVNLGASLLLASGGSIVMNPGNTATVVLNAPMVIEPTASNATGSYTFANNSTSTPTNDANPYKMTINGDISGGATSQAITLNFAATTGNRSDDINFNFMNGAISDGLAIGGVSVNVTGLGGQLGVWRFTNANSSYTGATTVTNGTLSFNSIANAGVASSIGAGSLLNVGANSYVKYTGAAAATDRAITGTGSFYNNGTGALTLNGTVAAGLIFRGSGNFIINGLISGSAGLARTDGGTVFLNNNSNSFTGNISISDGAFQATTIFNTGVASAAGAGNTISLGQASATNGRFEYAGTTTSTDRLIVLNNAATGNTGRGTLTAVTAGQTITFTNGVRLATANTLTSSANFSDLTLNGAGNGEIQGQIGGVTGTSGTSTVVNLQIIKSGTGTWVLSGANTYALQTFVNAGILNIRNSAALGAVMSSETVPSASNAGTIVASGATLQLQNNISVGAEALSLSGTGASGQTGALVNVSGTNTFGGVITLVANATVSSDSGTLILSNTAAIVGGKTLTLGGAGNGTLASNMDTGLATLVKTGTGTWTLTGTTSTFAGTTTVSAGILNVQTSNGLGAVLSTDAVPNAANAGTIVASGATLQIQGNISIGAEALTLAGTGASGQTGALVNVSGTNSFGGTITLSANATISSDSGTLALTNTTAIAGSKVLTLGGAGNGNLASNMNTGITGLIKTGTGTWTLGGTSTYTGTTTVSAGTLNITGTLGNTAVTVNGGTMNVSFGGSGGTGTFVVSNGTLNVNSGGAVGNGTVTVNSGGLVNVGGTLGNGNVTVNNGGTFNVTGTTGTGTVTVTNGGTLAGSGSLGGNVTASSGSTLSMGDVLTPGSTGTLTVGGNLALNDNTLLLFDLGTSSDLLQVTGNIPILDGVVKVTPGAGFGAGTYKLIGYTGTLTTDNGLVAQMLTGYTFSIVNDTVNKAVNLVATILTAQYFDGTDTAADSTVDGGSGIWTNAGTNWTSADGSTNTSWTSAVEKIAVFSGGTGGTVSVQDTVTVNGLQFAKNYTLSDGGGKISLASATTEIRVDKGVTATIATPVTGSGLNKTGDGTLVFTAATGSNTYTGTTLISSGTLKIGATDTLPTGTAVVLGSAGFAATLDLSSASQRIASLQLASNSGLSDTVIIGAGQTLTVTGNMLIGVSGNVKVTTNATITGGGSLVVNNTAANFEAGQQTVTSQTAANQLLNATQPSFDDAANANTTITDLTGLASFTANVGEFRVAQGINNKSTLYLSNTSNSITANSVQISNSTDFNAGNGLVILGTGTNVISTDTLNLGVSKGNGTLQFASQTAGSAGTVVIGGKTGSTVNILVGGSLGTNTGAFPTGVLDLRGHVATVTAGTLTIGKRSSPGGGGATGTVYFDTGTFTANSVEIGTMSGNAGSSAPGPAATGTLNISGGTFTVNAGGSFVLATYANTNTFGTANATVNITGGTLISNVNITEGGGTGSTTANTVSTINLSGGTLDMTGHSIGTAANTINVITLASGTLKDVSEINGGGATGAITKTTTGTLTLLGTNTYTGSTTISAGTVQVGNGGTSGTLGSGTVINNATLSYNRSDLLVVSNAVSGSGVVNQTGTGTTVVSGPSTYTGQTTVSAGTVLVNNTYSGPDSATGTNTVQVSSGATLGGSGRIAGAVNLATGATFAAGGNAATIAAGTSGLSSDIGTVYVGGNFTAAAGSTISLQVKTGDTSLVATFDPITSRLTGVSGTAADGGNDRLIVAGALTLDAASTLSVTAAAGFTPSYQAVFKLVDWSGTIPLAFYDDGDGKRLGGSADNAAFALDLPDLSVYSSQWFWDVSLFGTTGVIAIVPEPSRALLLLFGMLALGMRRKRMTR